eukprot:CAMPEP_0175989874 /NCGR_PEP_ID=MMETSP0108-20121206/51995_1 /TAXON_ID=195067 ORGANISM="Goniomonas pacifica, Strain CCMP1869" /NCGR_SAMPLE_ID=MMETSP0108 /ASSEMBLY_ACC=CAM_ASM_000204 /LENGTH=45 /DNA_ID= /DNA_START= /DNA_END= /DNA_ORIENTATION=
MSEDIFMDLWQGRYDCNDAHSAPLGRRENLDPRRLSVLRRACGTS